MRKYKTLQDVFPVWKIEQDCLLGKDGSVTVAYLLTLPEIFTLSAAEYTLQHSAWVSALQLLPAGTLVHKQDWLLRERYQPRFTDTEDSFLAHHGKRHFGERPFLQHETYLFLTMPPGYRYTGSVLGSWLVRGSVVPPESLDEQRVNDFLDNCSQFVRVLTETGLTGARRLTATDLESTDDRAGLLERYCYLSGKKEQRVISDIRFSEDVRVGEKHVRLYTLCEPASLPAVCGPRLSLDQYSTDTTTFSIGFAAPIGLLLDSNHIVNQYIIVQDTTMLTRSLEKKRLKFQSLSAYSRANAASRDAIDRFLQEAVAKDRRPVKMHVNIIAFTDLTSGLRELHNNVAAGLSRMGAVIKQETAGAPMLFWAGIPGNAAGLPAEYTFDTFGEQACSFLVSETNYRSSLSPFGLRLSDRLTGLPLHVDLSDEPMEKGIITNRNKFVLGPSGTGKSMCCNHLVRSYVEQGTHVVLVDIGHSYRGLCSLLGGYYFTYEEKNPIRFNPFVFEGETDSEKKESIKTLLLALWKKDDETFTRSEYVAVSSALDGYLKQETESRNFNSFYEYVRTGFTSQLEKEGVTSKEFDLSNFLYVLRPYYRGGEFDYLLNATENLDLLSQRLIVFELDTIKDHPIFPVVTLIIMEVFLSKMRRLRGVRKMILIEEAWKAIARQGMAEYIKYLFKTVRKFFGEAIVVTQDVDDIVHSPIVKDTIINSSDCKILLDMSKYVHRFDQVQALLGLSDKEKTLLLSLNKANDPAYRYKELLVCLGGAQAKVYRMEFSLEEYLAYTTEEKEKLQVLAYAEQYGSMQEGIRVLANTLREQQKQRA